MGSGRFRIVGSTQFWGDPCESRPGHSGNYDICPYCNVNRKRDHSKRCKACQARRVAVHNSVRNAVAKFVKGKGSYVIKFRPKSEEYGDLYDTVRVRWYCGHYVGAPKWHKGADWTYEPDECGREFETDVLEDDWVLGDAEAVCPKCGATLTYSDDCPDLIQEECSELGA